MATVPELKAIATQLGITGLSRMRKAEIEQAIATAESASNKINSADPTPTPARTLTRAERASQAGSKGTHAQPMPNLTRALNYDRQCGLGPATPAQSRRMRKKGNKLSGLNGCTLAQYREMRRRMKSAGMIPAGQR